MAQSVPEATVPSTNGGQVPQDSTIPMVNEEQLRVAMAALSSVRLQNANPTTNAMADPMSPFFLHHSENPELALVSTPFTEGNCHYWSQAMIMALDSKNKMGFVDDSLPESPLGDPMKSI